MSYLAIAMLLLLAVLLGAVPSCNEIAPTATGGNTEDYNDQSYKIQGEWESDERGQWAFDSLGYFQHSEYSRVYDRRDVWRGVYLFDGEVLSIIVMQHQPASTSMARAVSNSSYLFDATLRGEDDSILELTDRKTGIPYVYYKRPD